LFFFLGASNNYSIIRDHTEHKKIATKLKYMNNYMRYLYMYKYIYILYIYIYLFIYLYV